MLKKILFINFILIFSLLHAQSDDDNKLTLPTIMPTAPDAAALWKFEDTPVNLNSGTTNISIPLFTISNSKINIPIGISYNSSGLKVSEVATQVGLGWMLNAGGMISKTIYGTNDETLLYDVPNGFQAETEVFDDNNFIVDGGGQPDIYQYNLPNKSGKFIYNYNREIKAATIPFDPIKIEHERYSNNYTITDVDGTIYEFGKPTGNIIEGCESEQIDGFNTWHLTKITSINKETIEFVYRNVSYTYDIGIREMNYEMNPFYRPIGSGMGTPQDFSIPDDTWCIQNALVSDYLLSEIVYKGGKVKFNYSDEFPINGQTDRLDLPGALALRKISHENYNAKKIKQYNFQYNYFGQGTDPNNLRLKLESIEEIQETETNKKFEFIYEESINLPNRLSYAMDHWGFYNGRLANNTLIPKTNFGTISIEGANREPDPNYTQANILRKIIYPTKGYSLFQYEQNQYLQKPGSQEISKSIAVDDEHDDDYNPQTDPITELDGYFDLTNAKTKNINGINHNVTFYVNNECYQYDEYGNPSDGDGELLFTIYDLNNNFITDISHTKNYRLNLPRGEYYVKAERPFVSECFGNVMIRWYEDEPVPAMNKFIGGVRIKKIEKNDDNGNIESKEFEYVIPGTNLSSGLSSFRPVYIDEYVKFYHFITNTNPHTGAESGVFKYFKYLGINSNSLIASQGVHYEYIKEKTQSNGTILYQYYPSENNLAPYCNLAVSNSGDVVNFEEGELSLTKSSMTPPNHLQNQGYLKSESYFDDNGDITLKSEYNYEFGTYPIDLGYGINRNSITYGLASILEETSPQGNHQVFTGDFKLFYYNWYQIKSGWNKLIQKKETKYFESDSTILTYDHKYSNKSFQLQETAFINSDKRKKTTKFYYPNDSNLLTNLSNNEISNYNKLITQHRINVPIQTDIMIDNKSSGRVRTIFDEFSSGIILPSKILQTKEGSVINLLETRIQYHKYDDLGNPLEVSKADGPHISYIWGYNQQYPVAKVENATRAQIEALSGFGSDFHTGVVGLSSAQENTLRTQLSNAMITTYTYEPLVGVKTITDPRGYRMTYHYDAFNRLKFVKDQNDNLVSENKYNYKN